MTHNYQYQNRTIIDDFSESFIEKMYDKGYVATRIHKSTFDQVRSLRINLSENFEFTSENKRILRKTEWLKLHVEKLPLSEDAYDFNIHKLGKKFYFEKNKSNIFSAAKIKELVTDSSKSMFNTLLVYSTNDKIIGYCICYKTKNIFHYTFPFYDLDLDKPNIGMGMIIKALQYSLKSNISIFYLGSVHEKNSLYKLQFNNMQWWDGKSWNSDIKKLKKLIK